MIKKIPFLILAVISLLAVANAQNETEDFCNRLFYQLVETGNVLNASSSNQIGYYQDFCFNITHKPLPFSDINLIPISLFSNSTSCDLNINKTILHFDLDTSINTPDIYLAGLSCNSIESWKWFVGIKKDASGYVINSIKIWYFLFIGISSLTAWLIYDTKKVNKIFYRKT